MRLAVRKTYKLFIGGAFPRSESGRSFVVNDASGAFLAHAAHASRKDVRDAVVAARKAAGGWAGRTGYNRGQILYRIAEMLEGRRAQFVAELRAGGLTEAAAEAEVDAAVDRWVWYAGWTDKITAIAGGTNPVAGPFLNVSTPVPTGVVGVLAPQESPLLGLVSVLAPVIATGNTAIVIADAPLTAITFAEVLATSDLPGGVVNILTGPREELAPWLASHKDINALDLTGASPALATTCEHAATTNLKRLLRPNTQDWTAPPSPRRMTTFLETRTIWHPLGT
ncbi:aldehyde dehydrogenase family protein [Actinocorallia sp. A-T 12471]|uniref:aldehyde dehydrogenase family protein n=1 Tax=Actinocorallia sp. A-T 12471 TaxID=3089813 RepID=UPI0029D3713B|nr:aldehyde dehydrogenase family protein [Actinocorallia sp. A-T 12471]MDX6738407.1 aldehyde dehydrogenase family protein [Actinocorallia sp. A-T 12471]